MLRETSVSDDFVGSVCQLIEAILPDQYPQIETISEAAGVSKRTLQRELAREGVIYRDLVGQIRFRMARKLLVESDMPLRNIAHEIGYASETQFVRAFRNWAGITPGKHRVESRLQ
jgi:AraC-like DNA-binding protein